MNYVRCTIVQWQWIPQRETQAEPELELESETGIQQIRAGMLKYCKNTEIQRAAVETKLRQQEQQLSRACSLFLPLFLSFFYLFTTTQIVKQAGKAHTENISRSAYGFLA